LYNSGTGTMTYTFIAPNTSDVLRVYYYHFNTSLSGTNYVDIFDVSVTTGEALLTDRTFEDVDTTSTEVVTKVNMSATGNKMTQLGFDLMRKPIPQTTQYLFNDTNIATQIPTT